MSKDKGTRARIVKCKCGYEGIRFNDNLICKRCGRLMEIIGYDNEGIRRL